MLSMARWMDVHDHSFELHYFARSSEEAAFLPLLQERCPEKLHTHLGLPRTEHRPVLDRALTDLPADSHVYMCGPAGFMDLVREVAEQHVPAEHVHQESFEAAAQPDASENTAFTVEFEGGTAYEIPADRSIVDVLQEGGGVDVDTSCQEGICGTCIMTVLAGGPPRPSRQRADQGREGGRGSRSRSACPARRRRR